MLSRCGEPTKYDHAPYGTVCKVIKTMQDEFELYIQLGADEAAPQWQSIGSYTVTSLENAIDEIIKKIIAYSKKDTD
jgi:hypothetical protein